MPINNEKFLSFLANCKSKIKEYEKHLYFILLVTFCISILFITVVNVLPHLDFIKQHGKFFAGIASFFIGIVCSAVISHFFYKKSSSDITNIVNYLLDNTSEIRDLPEHFMMLRWISYITCRPGYSDEVVYKERKEVITEKLYHKRGLGTKFITYYMFVTNTIGERVRYEMTFIGARGRVIAIVKNQYENASILIFNSDVPSTGTYYGVGYLVGWNQKQVMTYTIISAKKPKYKYQHINEIKSHFYSWVKDIDIPREDVQITFNEMLKEKLEKSSTSAHQF